MRQIFTLAVFAVLLFLITTSVSPAANTYEQLTGGECKTISCYTRYTIRQATGGQCETAACYCAMYPCGGSGGYVHGSVDADSDGDVDGYIYLEDGSEVYFEGEFSENGEIEGYDENGNYYDLDVD